MSGQAVTHQGYFGLFAKQIAERIYIGEPSPIVLTVAVTWPPFNASVEVFVDEHPIDYGLIEVVGSESRTFHIKEATTIELRRHDNQADISGTYTISVLMHDRSE